MELIKKEYSRADKEKWTKKHIQSYKQVLKAKEELTALNIPTTSTNLVSHMVDQWEANETKVDEEII
jgi:hypothetical protein